MRSKLVALLATAVASSAIAISGPATAWALPEISPTPTPTTPITFMGSGEARFEVAPESRYECGETIEGKFVSATNVEAVIKFSGCSNMPKFTETKTLAGTLGSVNKVTKWVGLELGPAAGSIFAEHFGLPAFGETALTGSIIGTVGPAGYPPKSPVNRPLESLTLEYRSSEGDQIPREFEGGKRENALYAYSGKDKVLVTSEVTLANFEYGGKGTPIEIKD